MRMPPVSPPWFQSRPPVVPSPGHSCAPRALASWGGSDAALCSFSLKLVWFVCDSLSATFPPTRDGAQHSEASEALGRGAARPKKTARGCGLTRTAGRAMKLNERSVAHYATCDSPADHAGFLRKRVERHHHHAHHHHATSYQRRWFVLKGNLLFYFEERESREPVGLVVLEGCTVELCEAAEEFAFAIRFDDAGARAYVLVADGQAAMEAWVKALSRASFDYMRLVVRELEKQLEEACKSLAACRKSPRRSSSSGRKRHLSNPALLPLQEKPAILENGYSTWGSGGGVPEEATCPDRDGGHVKPPPLPPRRRSAASSATGSPAPGLSPAMPESPVSPETACFSKLHSWYGQEIAVLRREWQERQKRGHP